MIAGLYRAVTLLSTPFVITLLMARRRRGKEHAVRFTERLGYAQTPRPVGRLIWFHAASVGEAVSILPVLQKLRAANPDVTLMVTTGTVTSADIVAQRYPKEVIHQFAPVDLPQAVARFLNHWKPDVAVWVESELWPNMVLQTQKSGVPMALINSRLSERAARQWRRLRKLADAMASAFQVCLAQSGADADRFRAMGFRNVSSAGNLKSAANPLPVDAVTVQQLLQEISGRSVWLALSIHPGEDSVVAAAHQEICRHHPGALCVVVPRHPPKAPTMLNTFEVAGLKTACRSRQDPVLPETQVYLADTMGETGTMMALATIAFVGKSIGIHGGQNPIEPARQGLAVVFGPNMENFEELAAAMVLAKAAIQVSDAAQLGATVSTLFADSTDAMKASTAFAHQEYVVVDHTVTVIADLLEKSDVGV